MQRKNYMPEQIVTKLKQIEVSMRRLNRFYFWKILVHQNWGKEGEVGTTLVGVRVIGYKSIPAAILQKIECLLCSRSRHSDAG